MPITVPPDARSTASLEAWAGAMSPHCGVISSARCLVTPMLPHRLEASPDDRAITAQRNRDGGPRTQAVAPQHSTPIRRRAGRRCQSQAHAARSALHMNRAPPTRIRAMTRWSRSRAAIEAAWRAAIDGEPITFIARAAASHRIIDRDADEDTRRATPRYTRRVRRALSIATTPSMSACNPSRERPVQVRNQVRKVQVRIGPGAAWPRGTARADASSDCGASCGACSGSGDRAVTQRRSGGRRVGRALPWLGSGAG